MKLKICGMKYNIEEVAALKPDYLGFIFWQPSARYFSEQIADDLRSSKKVGVFVDASIEEIVLSVYENGLEAIQLHGKEDPSFCSQLYNLISAGEDRAVELIKAFAVNADFDFESLVPYESVCDFFLFDTRGELPGGTGQQFDWELLKNYRSKKPFFLSGGIGPADSEKLLGFLGEPVAEYCYAIDVNSRFEKEPGLKDIKALKTFINEIGFQPQKK